MTRDQPIEPATDCYVNNAARAPSASRNTVFRAARVRALRGVARLRRRYGALLLAVPALLVVGTDLLLRGDRIAALPGKYWGSYLAAAVESALFWGLLLFVAARRRGALRHVAAVAFVLLAVCAMGTQVYFHKAYATYLNLDATLFGTSFSHSVFGQLKADAENILTKLTPPFLLAAALVFLTRMFVRPRRRRLAMGLTTLAPVMLVAVFVIPCSYRKVQASTPDVIYFHALGGLAKKVMGLGDNLQVQIRPGLRNPPKMPTLSANSTAGSLPKKPARNVVFVLTESVRADVACSAFTDSCPAQPETNAAVPNRIALPQLRSNASTTAIQLAVLWSGLEPSASRQELHAAPLLFDYAHAAGIDTAYWTSHHMMFANSRLWVQDLPTSHRIGATDLDPLADIDLGANDAFLTERVEKEIGELKEPFFAVIHFGNTHVPYMVDPAQSPFQPSEDSKDEAKNEAYKNYYKNAVYLQDKSIGRMLRFLKKAPFADRTVIVYTSDHGEAFREHGQLGHTGAILDEEIRVPGWVDAPAGTLSDAEKAALEKNKTALLFHTDFTPTMLDLMGLWDEPQIASYKGKMVGHSFIRPFGPERETMTLAMTNCSGVWGCAYKNWGVMRGSLKVEGREWNAGYRCYDVLADPLEKNDLGAACNDLVDYANKVFGEPPSGK
ncbi:MAG: sulfatase-like hydrolase/transferase [Polyangiaceae bacterium]|nr:sulfatase-like hydrolase/transferase [Polyangiaceae bacterium]